MKRKENGFQRRTLKDIKRVRFLEPVEPNLISSEKLRKTIFPGYGEKERVDNGIDLYRLTRVPSIKKLRRLQAAIKGWYTRKVIIPKKKENEKLIRLIAYQMLYKKIDQVFMNEAIFEAMTEIKQKDFHTYTIKSQRRTYRYADYIITNVVKKFAQEALDQMLRFDVKKILRNKQMSRIVDPIELICYELIGKVSKETSKELVSVSIDEVTQEYKTNCTINRIVRQNIIPLSITELVKQSAHECIVETMFDDIIERLAFAPKTPKPQNPKTPKPHVRFRDSLYMSLNIQLK